MSTAVRRQRLWEILCLCRHSTYDRLADEFRVSKSTIRHDIAVLTCSYPIETVSGRYGGGVRVREDYWPYRKIFNMEQIDCLIRMSKKVEGTRDFAILSTILFQIVP